MFWKLATGVAWRDLPERYGPWQTVFERFSVWRDDGTLAKVVATFQEQFDVTGQLDWVQFNIDGATVRASRAAGGARKKGGPSAEPPDHALGRSRGGFGAKLHLLCDGNGVPLAVCVTGGQAYESTQFESVLDSVAIRRSNGQVRRRSQRVAADKAYDVPRIRRSLRERGIQAVIPPKQRPHHAKLKVGRPVTYNKQHYRKRNVTIKETQIGPALEEFLKSLKTGKVKPTSARNVRSAHTRSLAIIHREIAGIEQSLARADDA